MYRLFLQISMFELAAVRDCYVLSLLLFPRCLSGSKERNRTGAEELSGSEGRLWLLSFLFLSLASFFRGEKIPYWAEVNSVLLWKRVLIIFV